MKRTIIGTAAAVLLLTLLFFAIYRRTAAGWAKSCTITFGTTAYHFWMRLLVGYLVDGIMKNRADLSKAWYQQRKWEPALYKKLRVKQWKNHVPTFAPAYLSPEQHSWDEIAQAMCQSELVHEVIIVLSFVPLLFAVSFGALGVFLLTSVGAALMDTVFVIVQRYNRPRVMRLAAAQSRHSQKGAQL